MAEKCPRCQALLNEKEVDGIKIDQCSSCLGIFLDENELSKIKENPDSLKKIDTAVSGSDCSHAPAGEDKTLICIRCKAEMEKVNFSYTSGIFIDYCPLCRSIWLDDSELEKTVSFLRANEVISKEESEKYGEALKNIKESSLEQEKKNFRSISSGGVMGSIVNFVYRMAKKISR
ncbi:MAG TPA: zf-TFIIB domain-containing protein [Candidatus Wallbacteria bacterium]|nr:zf-TFIIB domain-containing protein [Candidatus Wallbacteria bacterium]